MNKLIISAFVLAFAIAVQAAGGFFGGGDFFGDDRSFDNDFSDGGFGRRKLFAGNKASLLDSARLSDRFKARDSDASSARLAASKTDKNAFAANNRKAGENFLKAQNQEQLQANHDLSKKSNFGLKIVDQKSHDESSNVAYKKGNQLAAGDRFKVDQGVKAQSFNDQNLKAAQDKARKAAVAKELEVEKETKAEQQEEDDFFEDFEQ